MNAICLSSWQRANWNHIVIISNIPKAPLGIALQFCQYFKRIPWSHPCLHAAVISLHTETDVSSLSLLPSLPSTSSFHLNKVHYEQSILKPMSIWNPPGDKALLILPSFQYWPFCQHWPDRSIRNFSEENQEKKKKKVSPQSHRTEMQSHESSEQLGGLIVKACLQAEIPILS